MTIPYARTLAELVPPVAVRLRRDFRAVLSLIRSHAILHQASRDRDRDGRIVAKLEDYAVVHDLVVDVVSEGVEATVSATIRETVAAVAQADEPLSLEALAKRLQLDKSATSRRWQAARKRGYLKNLEDKRGRPAKIVLGEPLPDEVEILPTAERLERCCSAASESEGAVRALAGDELFPVLLADAVRDGHLTESEAAESYAHHKLVLRARESVDLSNEPPAA